ncbi:hypothetical protein [Pseudanabaena sp. PCC 6802]|uniref:hypothetical protein n=1 Tax=Pseudanabaena sp. PCC 6802 TaxID=118173 RepID=UPI001CED2F42|nr:hypothetical protein [Pseudanabaena sp. PCC 6802]
MMCYTPIASQLFISCDRPDPLSELEQKTDPLCLPNLELLIYAIADPLLGLANVTDTSCLLVCDRTQTISTDSIGDIGTYNVPAERLKVTSTTQPRSLVSPLQQGC